MRIKYIDSNNFADITEEDPNFTGHVVDTTNDHAWYRAGKLHREDGPAVERPNGYKGWYQHGKRHREDGPAREWADRHKEWWINGQEMSEEDHKQWLRTNKLKRFFKEE